MQQFALTLHTFEKHKFSVTKLVICTKVFRSSFCDELMICIKLFRTSFLSSGVCCNRICSNVRRNGIIGDIINTRWYHLNCWLCWHISDTQHHYKYSDVRNHFQWNFVLNDFTHRDNYLIFSDVDSWLRNVTESLFHETPFQICETADTQVQQKHFKLRKVIVMPIGDCMATA